MIIFVPILPESWFTIDLYYQAHLPKSSLGCKRLNKITTTFEYLSKLLLNRWQLRVKNL